MGSVSAWLPPDPPHLLPLTPGEADLLPPQISALGQEENPAPAQEGQFWLYKGSPFPCLHEEAWEGADAAPSLHQHPGCLSFQGHPTFPGGGNVRLKVLLFPTSGGCESSLGEDLLLHNKCTGNKVQRKDLSLPTLLKSSLSGGHHQAHIDGNEEMKSVHGS